MKPAVKEWINPEQYAEEYYDSVRSHAFCFTINNYTFDDLMTLLDVPSQYLVIGYEVGENGTPHIQGYVYFPSAHTRKAISKKYMPRAWIKPCKGNPEQNFDYCSKQVEYYEFGDRPSQGKASWDKIDDVMKNPKQNPQMFMQYRKAYKEIVRIKERKRDRKVYLLSHTDIYDEADKHESVFLNVDINTPFKETLECYDSEDVMIVLWHDCIKWINGWYRGYPYKMKRGYEIINVDPDILFVVYRSTEERQELVQRLKDFLDYI